MDDVDYVAELERAGVGEAVLEMAVSMGGTAIGAGALAAALGAGPLALPAAMVGLASGGVTAMLLSKLALGVHARRRILRRGAASARVVQALGDVVDGELVRVTGTLRVCAPVLDPATEEPVGAYARWALRSASCECWGACTHSNPQDALRLVFEGRSGELELHLDSGIVRVAQGWADTSARAPLSVAGHGGELLREGDTVALVGRARRAKPQGAARGYRGAGTCVELSPGIAALLLFERVSEAAST